MNHRCTVEFATLAEDAMDDVATRRVALNCAPADCWSTYVDRFSGSLFRGCKILELRVLGPRRPHRQVDRTHTGVDAKRHRLRCGPDKWPIGGCDSDAEAMTGGKGVGYVVELDNRLDPFAGRKRSGKFVTLAMAEIEHAIADQCGGPVGKHIVEAYNCLGYRAVAIEDEAGAGACRGSPAARATARNQRPATSCHPPADRLAFHHPCRRRTNRRSPVRSSAARGSLAASRSRPILPGSPWGSASA